jgi:hypothetical protein
MSLHGLVMLQVPLHDEPSFTIDVNVPWRVIPLPEHERIVAAAYLTHLMMLPHKVTLVKSLFAVLQLAPYVPHITFHVSRFIP